MLSHISEWGLWLIAVGGGLGVLVGWVKVIRPWLRTLGREYRAGRDSLLGREAITDTITGREIAPALPGIGQRMDTIETALAQLVDVHVRLNSHDKRLTDLEAKDLERAMARTESIEMLRTIDTAIRSTPHRDDEEN